MPRSSGSNPFRELIEILSQWVLVLGGLAMILGLGYVAYGIFGAPESLFGVGMGPQAISAEAHQVVLRNLQLVCNALLLAGTLVIAAALWRFWMYYEAGLALSVLGAVFMFGVPFLVASAASNYTPRGAEAATSLLTGQFFILGAIFLGVGAVHLLIHTVLLFTNRQARRPKVTTDISQGAFQSRKLEKRDQFLGPCWNLPFCRDSVKRVCPVLHSRKPCWRDGRGCYCDNAIVLMLSGDRGARAPGRSASGFISMQSLTTSRPKSMAEKRAQCLGCPIYLHRQSQKYRIFAPTCVAAVLALILLNKAWIDDMYPRLVREIGLALARLSFGAGSATTATVPDWAADLARQTSVEWMVVLVGGMLLVSYLVHTLEWALYKLGL